MPNPTVQVLQLLYPEGIPPSDFERVVLLVGLVQVGRPASTAAPAAQSKKLLTSTEAAVLLGTSASAVTSAAARGTLRFTGGGKRGAKLFYTPEDVEAYRQRKLARRRK